MLKHKTNAILFDMDGVLVDSLDAWHYVFNDTLKYFGLKTLSKKEFKKGFGSPIEHDMKKYYIGKTVKEVTKLYNTSFKNRKKLVKIFPQSRQILMNLKKLGIKIGLLTNSTKPITMMILNRFKIKRYFEVILTMEDAKRRKPNPEMVVKACRLLKVKPENTILIGDSINDIIAGRRAKVTTIGYKVNGDYRIKRLEEVNKFI